MIATIIGARGFIGSALAQRVAGEGIEVQRVGRGEAIPPELGHVYFCAGLTADFRKRPHDTIDAHVTLVNELLRASALESFTYLSSTRVYMHSTEGREESAIIVVPQDPSDLYNLSKLTGEAICLTDPRESVRVVRLSNVFGLGDASANFLAAVLGEASASGSVTIETGRKAAKDYIAVNDAVEAVFRVPFQARSRILNVASGVTTTNEAIGALLQRYGAKVAYADVELRPIFPQIDNRRMREELGVEPQSFDQAFAAYIEAVQRRHS